MQMRFMLLIGALTALKSPRVAKTEPSRFGEIRASGGVRSGERERELCLVLVEQYVWVHSPLAPPAYTYNTPRYNFSQLSEIKI
jgi:hypothetical protein